MKKFLIVFCSVLLHLSLFAQVEDPPSIRWVRYYHADGYQGASCEFRDVFAIPGGGYVCSGTVRAGNVRAQGWLLVTNEVGNRTHELTFSYEGNHNVWTAGYSVIKTNDGGYLMGGRTQINSVTQMNFDVMKVDQDGEEEWWEVFSIGRSTSFCWSLIELKEGNYVASGQGDSHISFVVMFNDDGDVIWSNNYGRYYLVAIREVADDGLVFAGYSPEGALLIKTDYEGEVIWRRTYDGGAFWNLISLSDGGFAACGVASNRGGFFLARMNNEGQLQWSQAYRLLGGYSQAYGLAEMPDGGMVLSGYANGDQGDVSAVIRVDVAGNLRWQRTDDELPDNGVATDYYQSIVKPDGSIIICGKSGRRAEDGGYLREGVLVCLDPDRSPPYIVDYSPEDLNVDVLVEDRVRFWVYAEDLQDDSLSYIWTMNRDTIATDTFSVIHFNDLGVDTVQCRVSDGEFADSILWIVHVKELYIDAHQPDTLNVAIRRNTTVDFSVTSRAIEGEPVEYIWIFNDEEIADGDSLSVTFEHGREHEVEAIAYRGDLSDNVVWQVIIHDLIVDYSPHELDFSVTVDTSFEFEVFPFDPDDDSLQFLWTLDGDSITDRSWLLVNFDTEGQKQLIAYVTDEAESDSLIWEITVTPNAVNPHVSDYLPDIPTLYAPSPNPFNSQTTVRYSMPTAGHVRLELFDLNGRLLTSLVKRRKTAGMYSVVIDGNNLVSGVYFVRMVVGGEAYVCKALLLK